MNPIHRGAALILLAFVALPALASSKLTPQECNDYPFVRVSGPLTRHQIEDELEELESVGYYPAAASDYNYPQNLEAAQQRLQAKYQRDCAPNAKGGQR